MDTSCSADFSSQEIMEKNSVPFFRNEGLPSTPSDLSSVSSQSSFFLEKSFSKSFSFRKKRVSKGKNVNSAATFTKEYMGAWSNFKPDRQKDCLPYDDILTANNAFMTLSPYRLEWESSFPNFLSLLANSVRREIADMFVYILPSLMESSLSKLSRDECQDLVCWWNGFAEFLLVVFSAAANALNLQHNAALQGMNRLAIQTRQDLTRELNRTIERLSISSEIPVKAMQKRVRALAEKRSARCLIEVEEMWSCLSSFVLLTLEDSCNVAKSFEQKTRTFIAPGVQEKLIQRMLSPPRLTKSIDVQDYIANVVISLTRWMRNEATARHFVLRFFKKKVERNMDTYCYRYVSRRQISRFQFDRRPHEMPKANGHKPSKVRFSDR